MVDKSKTITIDMSKAAEQLADNPALAKKVMALFGGPVLAEAYEEIARLCKMYQDQVDLNLVMVRCVQQQVKVAVEKERSTTRAVPLDVYLSVVDKCNRIELELSRLEDAVAKERREILAECEALALKLTETKQTRFCISDLRVVLERRNNGGK